MKAVIMCGGKGSRLRPLTENVPKPMIKVLNKPVIDIILNKVAELGIKDIYLSLGYLADEIVEYCKGSEINSDIHYCYEKSPLGTAGGVKNCINNTNDDILVLSGDNIFDIDIGGFISFFKDNNCIAAICGVKADDPREYGTVVCEENGKIISFIEKPTWEQANSFLVNTGIYLIKGKLLNDIPDNAISDFASDVFPHLLKTGEKFYCYQTNAYWGDMGEASALKRITRDILDGKCTVKDAEGIFYRTNTVIGENVVINAPCLIANDVSFGKDCIIGPYTVLGSGCVIEGRSQIIQSILGEECLIGENSQIADSVLADRVCLSDNCVIEENCVLGDSVFIGRFSRVLSGNRIWPGRRIPDEFLVSSDMHFGAPVNLNFDIFGVKGKAYEAFSLDDALTLGKAIASEPDIKRIGIGTDGSVVAEHYKNCTASGISVCGSECFDYGTMFKSQAHFFAAFSSLDFFIFICKDEDIISFSFFGFQGLPVASKTARSISNNCKFAAYKFEAVKNCSEVIPSDYLSSIYSSYVKGILGKNTSGIKISIESDNKLIRDTAGEIFTEYLSENVASDKRCMYFLFNKNVSEMYVVYGNGIFSGERLISLVCELELSSGRDIIIPEDFPSFIEDYQRDCSGKVFRVYDKNRDTFNFSDRDVLRNLWAFDCMILTAKLISLLQSSGLAIDELLKNQKYFVLRKSVLTLDKPASAIRAVIESFAEKSNKDDIYYVFENRSGRARIRQLGNSAKIRILAESYDIESAKEIAGFITKKIKECNIDNSEEKL